MKEHITIVLETLKHTEFLQVAEKVSKHLKDGSRVTLELVPGVAEQSVRSLLVGRYLPQRIVSKLVIKQQKQPT